jgi:hypothetical protein
MSRKSDYAEMKRLTKNSPLFTPERFVEHLQRTPGQVIESRPMRFNDYFSRPPSTEWSTASEHDPLADILAVRESIKFRKPEPFTINNIAGAMLWANISRFHPNQGIYASVQLDDEKVWTGVFRGRDALTSASPSEPTLP